MHQILEHSCYLEILTKLKQKFRIKVNKIRAQYAVCLLWCPTGNCCPQHSRLPASYNRHPQPPSPSITQSIKEYST